MSEYVPYRDYLRPRGLTWIKATLRVTVAVQCLGAAAQSLSGGSFSPIADFLMVNLEWPEASAGQVDEIAAYALLGCGILTALRPVWLALIPVTLWFAGCALVPVVRSVHETSVLMTVEQAVRYLGPLALLILDFWPPTLKSHLGRTVVSMWILRLALAATFSGIGLLAIIHGVKGGASLSMFQSVLEHSGGIALSEQNARCWLSVFGGFSLALALNVLCTRSRPILFVAAAWGAVSAFSRMVDLGLVGYPETLVRFAEIGVPVVLLLYFSLAIQEFPAEVVPEN